MMKPLSHSQLNLLSQITALALPVPPENVPCLTVANMVNFHADRVKYLDGDAAMSPKEWQESLSRIQQDDQLMDLHILASIDRPYNGLHSLCFSDKSRERGILTFRGTVSLGGWIDNYRGGFVADTPQQASALAFKHRMDRTYHFKTYDLAGHSKGGNCAQYITILEGNTIDRCLTFNAPGFSAEFVEKYNDGINAYQHKITAYEGAYDMVNVLLNSVAGERIVVDKGSIDPNQNHKPNRFLDARGQIRRRRKRNPILVAMQNATIGLTFAAKDAKAHVQEMNQKRKKKKKNGTHS